MDYALPPQTVRTVLVVDDDRMLLSAISRVMVKDGFLVETATSAAAALKAIDSAPIDLVISDMCMPRMDGLELLDALATRGPGGHPMPFILVSGNLGEDDRSRAIELGAEAALDKPIDLSRLTRIARSVTRFREAKAVENR